MIRLRWSLALLLGAAFAGPAPGQALEVVLQTGKHGPKDSPVRVPLQWPREWKTPTAIAFDLENVKNQVGQLTEPSFVTEKIAAQGGKVRKDLVFTASELQPDKSYTIKIAPPAGEAAPSKLGGYSWKEQPGQWAEVSYQSVGGKSVPVMRYMEPTHDASSADAHKRTYKVFHHLYDPAGTRFVTNGGHTDAYKDEKALLYPHHRGLMFAFNRITYGAKQQADTWHCNRGEHTSHLKTIFQTAGPVMAEHRVLLGWFGQKNDPFAEEERQMSVYKVPGGTLVEFASRLRPKVENVHLDGDPQHAGFQFRASNDVADKSVSKQTYYLRPDGKGNPGETRNWDAKKKGPVNLPWDVLCFVLDGKRYSVAYIDHPDNPGEKRYSERDYGRFGCYFEYDLTAAKPLVLNHRIWLQEGEMTQPQAEALRQAFVEPPRVTGK